MFADPQSVTVNAVAKSLPAIRRDDTSSSYRMDTGDYTLKVTHREANRNRRTVQLDFQKIAADPFAPSVNQKFTGSIIFTVDAPVTGFTNVELKDTSLALVGWLTSANVLKVLGGES